MNIKILGPGCSNCKSLERVVNAAIAETGIQATVEKVEDYAEIARFGIMSTPGLVVNGAVKTSGRIPSKTEVIKILTASS